MMKNVHVGWRAVGLTEILPDSQPKLTLSVSRINGEINKEYTISIVSSVDEEPTWTSSNPSVATVDSNGVVTITGYGLATITVKVGEMKGTCTIIVKEPVISVAGVTLDKDELTMKIGDVVTLIATVTPDNASDKTVTWSSTKSTVAKVSGGKITALSSGETEIKVTTKDGKYTDSCVVIVEKEVEPEIPSVDNNYIYYGATSNFSGYSNVSEEDCIKAYEAGSFSRVSAEALKFEVPVNYGEALIILIPKNSPLKARMEQLGSTYEFSNTYGHTNGDVETDNFKIFGEVVTTTAGANFIIVIQ